MRFVREKQRGHNLTSSVITCSKYEGFLEEFAIGAYK